jgi:hypothetical protein
MGLRSIRWEGIWEYNIKMDHKGKYGRAWPRYIGSVYKQLAGCCKHRNEFQFYVRKVRKFLAS